MFEISKTFEISIAHRIPRQVIRPVFALTDTCKCERIHGHNLLITVVYEGNAHPITETVFDFTDTKILKKWLDDNWDHKFLICDQDPLANLLTGAWEDDLVKLPFFPTSEMLAKELYRVFDLYKLGNLKRIEISETSSSKTAFTP